MRGSKVLLTAAAMAAFSMAGFAQTATSAPATTPNPDPAFQQGAAPPPKNLPPGVKADSVRGRDKVEADRIADGVKNGSLTPQEAATLKRNEKGVIKEEQTMKADSPNGKLTRQEKQQLTRQQNHLSHEIHTARHNGQRQ